MEVIISNMLEVYFKTFIEVCNTLAVRTSSLKSDEISIF